MTVAINEKYEKLRFDIGAIGVGTEGQRQGGVCVAMFTKIPFGATLRAILDIPTELSTNIDSFSTLSPGKINPTLAAQGYVFEHAVDPSFTAGFVNFTSRNRALVTNGLGQMQAFQVVPAWAAFSPVQSGSLIQRGRKVHSIPMTGADTTLTQRGPAHMLRLRWTGTAVAAQNITTTGTGAKQTVVYQCLDAGTHPIRNIAPGSIVGHFTVGGNPQTFRDDGRGRVVGVSTDNTVTVDGSIDYLSGIITFTFFAPGADNTTAITLDFEHSCLYQPIDAYVSWLMDEQRGDQ